MRAPIERKCFRLSVSEKMTKIGQDLVELQTTMYGNISNVRRERRAKFSRFPIINLT